MAILKNLGLRALYYTFIAFLAAFAVSYSGSNNSALAEVLIEQEEGILTVEENRGIILKLERDAANIFIANSSVADVQIRTAKVLYVLGRSAGITTFYAVDDDNNIIYSAEIHVKFNVDLIQDTIAQILPESSIKVDGINGMILLTGFVKSPEEADLASQIVSQIVTTSRGKSAESLRVMNQIQIQTPTQVNLRVKVAEMSRNVAKSFGFNWDIQVLSETGASLFGFSRGPEFVNRVFDENGVETLGLRSFERSLNNSALFNNVGGLHDVNGILDALEDEGFLSILAEPNLTALSGETASFLAGGEFPIPVLQDDNNGITVTFRQFGVSLAFTPTVLADNKINLKVAPEVSALSDSGAVSVGGFAIPALTTRRVNTTLELGSGQSFAVAGLLQSDITQAVSKFPFLGDIPILGTLFRSDSFQRMETELVIIVTPYIVRPVNGSELITPLEVNNLPVDAGRWIKGRRTLTGDGGLDTGEGER